MRSAPSFFELTYMLLRICQYRNNGVTNGLKQEKEKRACKTALYGKIKGARETGVEYLIGAHMQNIPYLSTVTKQQHTTKTRKATIAGSKGE